MTNLRRVSYFVPYCIFLAVGCPLVSFLFYKKWNQRKNGKNQLWFKS